MNADLYQSTLSAFSTSLDALTSQVNRERWYQFINQLKYTEQCMPIMCRLLSEVDNICNENVMDLALSTIIDWTKTWWNYLPDALINSTIQLAFDLLTSHLAEHDNPVIRTRIAMFLVTVVERSFPQNWPALVPMMIEVWKSASFKKQGVILKMFEMVFVDSADANLNSEIPTLRRQEIVSGIVAAQEQLFETCYQYLASCNHALSQTLGATDSVTTGLVSDALTSLLSMLSALAVLVKVEDFCAVPHNFALVLVEMLGKPHIQVKALGVLQVLVQRRMPADLSIVVQQALFKMKIDYKPASIEDAMQFQRTYIEVMQAPTGCIPSFITAAAGHLWTAMGAQARTQGLQLAGRPAQYDKAHVLASKGTAGSAKFPQKELFSYMRAIEPPRQYGSVYRLPPGLQRLFKSGNCTDDLLVVRDCYERVIQIVDRSVRKDSHMNGVIFTAAQGNSKTWCSLYVAWHLIRTGRCVVYEVAESALVYVIKPTGEMLRFEGAASEAKVHALDDKETIHIYCAKAKAQRQPAVSAAFLLVFSARSRASYAQIARLPAVEHYCIPSYELGELLQVCAHFSVTPDEVRARVMEIGPSLRYVLVNDYAASRTHTLNMAQQVRPEQLEAYMRDYHSVTGVQDDISASLLQIKIDESLFEEDPRLAYEEDNVIWEFASEKIRDAVLENARTQAKDFVRNFITEVNRRGMTQRKGVAGNFLEDVVGEFLLSGNFPKARRLTDGPLQCLVLEPLLLWNGALTLERSAKTIDILQALRTCNGPTALYYLCKTFVAVDYAALDFRVLFHITVSGSHGVQLEALRTICRYVKNKYPANPTVKLVFVVPEEVVSFAGPAGYWCGAQPFEHDTERVDQNGVRTRRKAIAKFDKLPAEAREDLQWVVCYTSSNLRSA